MAGRRKLEQCSATASRTGEQCKAKAIPGGKVCRYHGGSTAHVAAAADKRLALAQIEQLTERLGVITNPDDPFEGASAALRQLRHMAQDTGATVAALTAGGALRYEHEKAGEQIRGEVVIWQRVVKDMSDLSLAIIRAGMDAKLTEISEQKARDVVSFVQAVLQQFGIDFHDPGVSDVVIALFQKVIRGEQVALPPPAEPDGPPELSYVCEHDMHDKCRAYLQTPGMPAPPPWPARCPCGCHDPSRGTRLQG